MLRPEHDPWLKRTLANKAGEIGCGLLAAGNADDHVHVLLCFPPRVSIARIVNVLKGSSARMYNLEVDGERPLQWQVGYYAESVGHNSLAPLERYIQEQRVHHAAASVRDEWEAPQDPVNSPR